MAAAPNSRIIGGAGTCTPLDVEVEVEVDTPLEVALEFELLVEAEEALLVLLDVLVPPPKLDEEEVVDTVPLDVEVEPPLVDDEVEPPLVEDELPPVEVELPPVELEVEPPDVELPPVEVELPPVEVELPPVEVEPPEVELPPVEVEVDTPLEVETPPVEVETPPVEVETPLEVEVEPPDVDTVTTVLPPVELPPKKLPEKKPLPKPKPGPLLPPMSKAGGPPVLLATATGGGGGGGTNIGGTMVRVVTPAAGAGQATRRTVRRTTRRWPRRTCAVRAFACLTIAGRAGGFSAMETAPPPMIAPPQVQAQSFAKAILTDITSIPSWPTEDGKWFGPKSISRRGNRKQMQTMRLSASALTLKAPVNGWIWPFRTASVPIQNRLARGVNGDRRGTCRRVSRRRTDWGRVPPIRAGRRRCRNVTAGARSALRFFTAFE